MGYNGFIKRIVSDVLQNAGTADDIHGSQEIHYGRQTVRE